MFYDKINIVFNINTVIISLIFITFLQIILYLLTI